MTESELRDAEFDSRSAGVCVQYRTLAPLNIDPGTRLPLIVHLHGAMSSAAFLDTARPVYDRAWTDGRLPPALVVCASTPTLGGFYIDYAAGPAWETLVARELPERLQSEFPLSGVQAAIGFSMGGYGALKLAMRDPQRYRAVAALCPAIFPGETSAKVPERNRPAILGNLNAAMEAGIGGYANNCVQLLVRRYHDAVATSGLRLFLECGERDEFGLHDGAVHLHRLLAALDLDHDWESLPDTRHADGVAERLTRAVDRIGEALAAATPS